jgi:Zinc knuckle
MPSIAGRVRMPHDNRMMTSSSLNTHAVWQNVIKYDPYASDVKGNETGDSSLLDLNEQSKGLMELAKLQSAGLGVRGTCKKCGGSGHLTFECRNSISIGEVEKKQASTLVVENDYDSDDDKPAFELSPKLGKEASSILEMEKKQQKGYVVGNDVDGSSSDESSSHRKRRKRESRDRDDDREYRHHKKHRKEKRHHG